MISSLPIQEFLLYLYSCPYILHHIYFLDMSGPFLVPLAAGADGPLRPHGDGAQRLRGVGRRDGRALEAVQAYR